MCDWSTNVHVSHLRLVSGGQLPTVAAEGAGQRRTKPATRSEAHRNQEHIAPCPFVVACGRCCNSRSPACPGWTSTRPDAFALTEARHPGKASVRCPLELVEEGNLAAVDHYTEGNRILEASNVAANASHHRGTLDERSGHAEHGWNERENHAHNR